MTGALDLSHNMRTSLRGIARDTLIGQGGGDDGKGEE